MEVVSEKVSSFLFEAGEEKLKTKNFNIKIENVIKNSDNFVGETYRVTFSVQKDDVATEERLVLKTASRNSKQSAWPLEKSFFSREKYVYESVFPVFERLQENMPLPGRFIEYPKLYKCSNSEPDQCLLIEDLTDNGFRTHIHGGPITLEHILLVLKVLAKFHAQSFILRIKCPEQFKAMTTNIHEILFNGDMPISACKYTRFINALTESNDTYLLQKMNQLHAHDQMIQPIAVECTSTESAEPFAVLCNGDVQLNNISFKYDEDNVPIDVRFVDWQFTRHASPVTDLVTFLFSSTTQDQRNKFYDKFIQMYYTSLTDSLNDFDLDLEVFPYEELQSHLKKFGKFALAATSFQTETSKENCSTLEQIDIQFDDGRESKIESNKRYREIVADIVRLGYI